MEKTDGLQVTGSQEVAIRENIVPGYVSKSLIVPKDAKDKIAKEREYFNSKENPGRRYNINDQAYSQSSPRDFIETVSKFMHNASYPK